MKLIWFSHFIPYPPKGGSHQRSYNLLRQAASRDKVHLIAFNLLSESEEKLEAYRAHLQTFCSSVEFWELPLRWKGLRWWGRLLRSPWMRCAFSPSAFWSRQQQSAWRRELAENKDALLHFDSSDLALFAADCAGFRKVLNHHNCESAMLMRRARLSRNPMARWYLNGQAKKLERIERELCHTFDANLTVSAEDAALLAAINPRAHFHVVENGTDVDFFRPLGSAEEKNTLIFAGSLDWYPNQSGLKYFREEIWPVLRKSNPSLTMEIAGRNPPEWMKMWAGEDPGVTLTANPDDIRPYIDRAAVFVCPIIDGGGTRLKLLDAMAMGKAIVTTNIGCEGLRASAGRDLLIVDSPAGFAASVQQLLLDYDLRQRLAKSAREFSIREYSWQGIGRQLQGAYDCAAGGKCRNAFRQSREDGISVPAAIL